MSRKTIKSFTSVQAYLSGKKALSVLRSNEKGGVYVTDSSAPVDEAARFPR